MPAAQFRRPLRLEIFLTRPLGATLGDLLTKTPAKGGLDPGTIGSSLVPAYFLIVCILVTNRHRPDGTIWGGKRR
ncbi:MAG: hypothetical protein ACRECP_06900 [Methylocella sp.]